MFAVFEEDGFFIVVEDNIEVGVFETANDAYEFLAKITK